MNWFEDWFDSPLYDALYADRDQKEAELTVSFLSEYLPQPKFNTLLDLGCGRGRHAITLAKNGYKITGVDLSPKSIQTARANSEMLNLQNVEFAIGDMRDPLDQTFDAVLNLFTSFGYFRSDDENKKVIKNMTDMTKTGGRVIIDYMNADKVTNSLKPAEEGELEGAEYQIRRFIDGDTIVKEITFNKAGNQRNVKFEERVKAYRTDWFNRAFHECGLAKVGFFGTYTGEPFDPENSPRLIMITEKK